MYWTDAFWLLGSASAEPLNNKLASPDRLTEFRSFAARRRAHGCRIRRISRNITEILDQAWIARALYDHDVPARLHGSCHWPPA
jgi:hypothetical protein